MTDFSPRELEVLQLLAQGKRNVEIATILGVKPRTLSQFKSRAAKKLGLDHPSDVALIDAFRPMKPAPAEAAAAPWKLSAELSEIAVEYPGPLDAQLWARAEPNYRARLADGETQERLRAAAVMYRRQHAAQTRLGVEALISRGIDPDDARRKAAPVPVMPPDKFFDFDGPWRGRFPLPQFVEIPPEPVGGEA